MRSISNEFAALLAANHTLLMKATLTLADSTVLNLTSEDFMAGSARFEQAVSSDGSFDIGGAIVGTMSVALANQSGRFDSYDFGGATIVPYVGKKLANNTYEWLRLGTYDVIKPDSYGGTIGLTCMDRLNRLANYKYSDLSITYPVYPQSLLSSVAAYCGFTISYGTSPVNGTVSITRAPDMDMTLLDAAAYLAQLMGYWLRCDGQGNIVASWYDTSAFAPGGTPYEIEDAFTTTVMVDDVTISGVQVTETDEVTLDEDGNEINGRAGETYLSGTSVYCLTIPSNPFIAYGTGQTGAAGLYSRVGGMSFRPYTNSMPCDPRIEAGDAVVITDRHGNTHNAYVTGVVLKPDGAMDTRCSAKAPASNSNAAISPLAKAVTAVKASVDRSNRVADSAKAIAMATDQHFWEDTNGVHISTEDKVPNGTRNILINSLGILLRAIDNYLAELSASGVVFYDGAGNNTSNVVASFGSAGAQIGKSSSYHVIVDNNSIDFVDNSGNVAFSIDVSSYVASLLSSLETVKIGHSDTSGHAIFEATNRSGLSSSNGNQSTLQSKYGSAWFATVATAALDNLVEIKLSTETASDYSSVTVHPTYVDLSPQNKLYIKNYAPIVEEIKTHTVSSTAAQANYLNSFSIAKTGYTPIGFQTWWDGGTRQNFFNDWGSHIEGNTFYVRLCNVHASQAANGTLKVKVLYVRSELL